MATQAAVCSKLVAYAIGEMNKWTVARGGPLRRTTSALEVSYSCYTEDALKDEPENGGVAGGEMEQSETKWDGGSGGDDDETVP